MDDVTLNEVITKGR